MKHDEAHRIPELDSMGYDDKSSYLVVNCVGFYEFEEYYRPTHRVNGRKDFYLAYNPYGQMKVRIKGCEYILEPGSVFIYRPFEEQYYGHGGKTSFKSYWVHFTGYGALELLERAGLSESCVLTVGISERIIDLFDGMLTEVRDKNYGYELTAASLLSSLVALVGRRAHSNDPENSKTKSEIYKSIKYIHENYNKKIFVKELAAMSHLCKDRYTCLFKELMHIAPQQYIIRLKIQKACELINRTSLSLGQISTMAGFSDQLYFSRIFKRYKKITPSEYLKRNRG